MTKIANITWQDFAKVDMRVGKIIAAESFPDSLRKAYVLDVDFGEDLGILKSVAQITHYYNPQTLVGQLTVGVVNFEPQTFSRAFGSITSECFICGFFDAEGESILCTPDPNHSKSLPLGTKLF